jgi:hypothetical protein
MSKSTGLTREQAIGYVNRYRGRDGVIWSGRTIFASPDDAQSCPCASKESYVDTLALLSLESRERITVLEGANSELFNLVDRAMKMMWLACPETRVIDVSDRNPIVAWVADAQETITRHYAVSSKATPAARSALPETPK